MRTFQFISFRIVALFAVALLACGCESPSTPTDNGAGNSSSDRVASVPSAAPREEPAKPVSPVVANEPAVAAKSPSMTEPTPVRTDEDEEKAIPPEKDPTIPEEFKPLNKTKTVFFEKTADGRRRVHVLAEVCLREGPLEVLLCRTNTKEHESILRADVDARDIHTALIAAGAKYGTTVRFVPEYKPATGDVIKVSVTYQKEGKQLTRPAQYWIQQFRTKKEMEHDWVFAGSRFFKDPDNPDKPPFYCANNGEFISIANFPDSMLDLPVKSSKEEAQLGFTAITDRIPPLRTKVIVTLEPMAAVEKK